MTIIRYKNKGFTLIELLVSMGIMAVLTGLAVFNFNQSRVRARDVRRKSDVSQLQKAMEVYRNDNNQYPAYDANFNNVQTVLKNAGYIKDIFHDPRESEWVGYSYKPENSNKIYYLMTCLENTADTTKTTDLAQCQKFSGDTGTCECSSGGVMYILTQP